MARGPCWCLAARSWKMTMHSYTSLLCFFSADFCALYFCHHFWNRVDRIGVSSECVHQPIFLLSKSHCRGDEGSNEVDGHHSQ